MPTEHHRNTTNGNAINPLCAYPGFFLSGRITNLPIYEIRYGALAGSPLVGPNFATIVKSMVRDNLKDAAKGYRQPTDHDDRLGNLPDAPGGKIVYREYFLPGNTFIWPGYLRLIADPGRKRLYITPTHYDVWLRNPVVAANTPTAALMPPGTAGARNPFFLVGGAGAYNDMFA